MKIAQTLFYKPMDFTLWPLKAIIFIYRDFSQFRLKNAQFQNKDYPLGLINVTKYRDHPFKTSVCLRGGGVSLCVDGQKVIVHKDKKSPSKALC